MSARGVDIDLTLGLPGFTLRVETRLPDRVTAVMGPSGAGKTSLLEAIAGLRRGARGRVAIGAEVLLDGAGRIALPPERRRVGYVPQDAGLFPHLSVLDNVRFGARADAEAVEAAIDTLEIRPLLDRSPRALSGGERQRVALARALAIRPRLLLLDEPLAALDPGLRERILPWLLRVRD
jgi:molybdate transport system ATP-binding protein